MSTPHEQTQGGPSHITPDPLPATWRISPEFEMQAALIPDGNRFEYQSPAKLISTIKTTVDSGSAEEYFLYFHGINHGQLAELEREYRWCELRCTARFTTENSLSGLICKILSGGSLNNLGINFWRHILFKIWKTPGHTCDSIDSFYGTRFNVSDVRSKEGYQVIWPVTRGARPAWPSVVLEVGYSEALDFLHLDAKWWLINSTGNTRFVTIVQLMTSPFAIHIECWAMVTSDDRQKIKGPPQTPACVQVFDIDAEGTVASEFPGIRIPYSCIFDEPNENAPDALLTNAQLSSFALSMFNHVL
ncbi:hypothetical protein B9Z19DRAFT_1123633 [Tuber borchii]|uniref:Uncharacterized protein n=1 Tax=Tuber borchii TaxID=42251 RepID=A0A2T6ZY22_TUBBO|nr:hypothetical protein B9Z19DRAFT_1123633 [Tuber borchii]